MLTFLYPQISCRCCMGTSQNIISDSEIKNNKIYYYFSLSNFGECWTSEDVIYDLTKLVLDEDCILQEAS